MDQQPQKVDSDLLELICDGLGLLVPLKPHHILGVEPPGLLLQGFGCKILGLSALQGAMEEEDVVMQKKTKHVGSCVRDKPPGSKR